MALTVSGELIRPAVAGRSSFSTAPFATPTSASPEPTCPCRRSRGSAIHQETNRRGLIHVAPGIAIVLGRRSARSDTTLSLRAAVRSARRSTGRRSGGCRGTTPRPRAYPPDVAEGAVLRERPCRTSRNVQYRQVARRPIDEREVLPVGRRTGANMSRLGTRRMVSRESCARAVARSHQRRQPLPRGRDLLGLLAVVADQLLIGPARLLGSALLVAAAQPEQRLRGDGPVGARDLDDLLVLLDRGVEVPVDLFLLDGRAQQHGGVPGLGHAPGREEPPRRGR